MLTDLGIGSDSVGSLLGPTGISELASLLNSTLGTLLGPQEALLNTLLGLIAPGLNIDSLISTS